MYRVIAVLCPYRICVCLYGNYIGKSLQGDTPTDLVSQVVNFNNRSF